MKKLSSEDPSNDNPDTEPQQLRDLSEPAEGRPQDSIEKWLELVNQLLRRGEGVQNK